jgi:hypothetical protein
VRPESLRFAVFFSSVAGRFGNRGQADYAAANEVLNKLAVYLTSRWPVRVSSLNWAPWDKRGMVSPELKRQFAERGVALIAPEGGRRSFAYEIQQPHDAPSEVTLAASAQAGLGGPAAPAAEVAAQRAPLLHHAAPKAASGGALTFVRVIDPAVDRYLLDHCLDGKPVLPLAFATELMAECAQQAWPELQVLAVRGLQLLKGVVLDAGPVPLEITVRVPVHMSESLVTTADVEVVAPGLLPPLRYRAQVDLAPKGLEPPAAAPHAPAGQPLPIPIGQAYDELTFHGPVFRRLSAIDDFGPAGMIGRGVSPSTHGGVRDLARVDWAIDPFVFDAALQMLLIWSRLVHGKTALPSRFKAFHRFGSLSDVPLTLLVAATSLAGGHAIRADVQFVGPDGRVLGLLEGMEASCSAVLNRLSTR